jgi:hypothetical protein
VEADESQFRWFSRGTFASGHAFDGCAQLVAVPRTGEGFPGYTEPKYGLAFGAREARATSRTLAMGSTAEGVLLSFWRRVLRGSANRGVATKGTSI